MSSKAYKTGRLPLLGQSNNAFVMLIAVNALIFVLLNFLKVIYFLSYDDNGLAETLFDKQIADYFILSSSLHQLLTRPWTLLIYMFSHIGIWGLVSTLLWLWAFGYILQDLTGNKKIFPIYLYGGFVGGVFYLLTVHFIPAYHQTSLVMPSLIGGGAAVMAIALATTTLAPQYRIFPLINGGIPLWVLTIVFVAIDYTTLASSNGAYAIAHFAAGFMGFVFIWQLKKGNDLGKWMNDFVDWFNDLFNPNKQQKRTAFTKRPSSEKSTNPTQQKLDELLDKIHLNGYEFLTHEEKAFLKKASKEEL